MNKELKETAKDKFSKHINMFRDKISKALPKHLTADRMCRIALTEVNKNPTLLDCDQKTLFGAIMQASQLGLEIGNHLGHAYLVPFNNNKKNIKEVQFIIGYRGMIDLSRRSGQIRSINAHAVFENDLFDFEFGINEKLKHIPFEMLKKELKTKKENKGSFLCAYAIAHLSGGGYQFEVMFKDKIDECKSNYSKIWKSHYEEMAKKTVIRKLFKYLPVSIEIQEAVIKEELIDDGVETTGYTYDAEEESEIKVNTGGTQAAIDALKEGSSDE